MITKAEYAEWLGRDVDDITDGEFARVLRKGRTRLEQALGYQLCPLQGLGIQFCPLVDTPEPTEEEIEKLPVINLPYKPFQKYLEVPPFLKLYHVKYKNCEGEIYELEDCDYIISQSNRYIDAEWNNTIELCSPLTCKLAIRGGVGFRCMGNCIRVEIKAYWGLCCGELPEEESGVQPERECCIPEDLQVVLLDMMAEADPCDKSNIKSESFLSSSYTKFDKVILEDEYSSIIAKYDIGKPEEYPI